MIFGFLESQHPRAGKGSPTGGQFVSSGRSKSEVVQKFKGAAKWPDLTKGAALSSTQAAAVRTYLQDHEEITAKLWDAMDRDAPLTGTYGVGMSDEHFEAVTELDQAITKHELAKDTTLYRVVTKQQREAFATLGAGSIIQNAGYVPATDDPALLRSFLGGETKAASLMEIRAAAGTKALDIGKVKQEAALDLFDKQMREVLFGREQDMAFTGYDKARNVFTFEVGELKTSAGREADLGELGIAGMEPDRSLTEDDYEGDIHESFPNLGDNFEVVGGFTHTYNCASFALGDNKKWWWPNQPVWSHSFWPEEADADDSFDAFDKLLLGIAKGKITENETVEKGFTKLALYSDGGEPSHLARQLRDGRWASKLGANALIIHEAADSLEESEYYGHVDRIYKVPTKEWQKIRDMN